MSKTRVYLEYPFSWLNNDGKTKVYLQRFLFITHPLIICLGVAYFASNGDSELAFLFSQPDNHGTDNHKLFSYVLIVLHPYNNLSYSLKLLPWDWSNLEREISDTNVELPLNFFFDLHMKPFRLSSFNPGWYVWSSWSLPRI